ncbi:transcription termination factor Rho [Candidatus Shapirobacteria bacterium]|nr:transcription termination factor Rho [Candidatus Shapirobacteria bacterium]
MLRKKTAPIVEEQKPISAESSDGKFVSTIPDIVSETKEETRNEILDSRIEQKEEVKVDKPQVLPVVNRVEIKRMPVTQQQPRQQQPVRPVAPPIQQIPTEPISGILEIMPDGQGFVRPRYIPSNRDAVIGSMQIRKYGLRFGDMIVGAAKAPRDGEKYWGMVRIDKVNDVDLMQAGNRPDFKDLVPIYPLKQLVLESDPKVFSTRIIDLFAPIGYGQRGMIASPPKAGKTTLLKEIAAGVSINYPDVHLMAVLVGERPEEVTDLQRFIKGEVIASHFDQKPEEQTRTAEIAIERAKRLVELGKDVFIVFDSITRLARAYNLAIPTSGRTLSGGFDPAALYPSKKFFGAARKIEGGGSLTIMGTALVDTGSKMDELIFEEFKGTGNMELWLTRELAERRVFPALDILKSGTRNEDLLLDSITMGKVVSMRRMFDVMGDKNSASEMIIEQMAKSKNNAEFLGKVGKK